MIEMTYGRYTPAQDEYVGRTDGWAAGAAGS
jgi:hypothetical protein